MTRTVIAVLFILLFVLACTSNTARADTPSQFAFQGFLSDAGVPVNGTVDIDVSIYHVVAFPPPGSETLEYSEAHSSVPVSDGQFTINIGSQGVLPTSLFFPSLGVVELGVSIDGGAELSPRIVLRKVPHAFRADKAQAVRGIGSNDVVSVASAGGHDIVRIEDHITIGSAIPFPSSTDIVRMRGIAGTHDVSIAQGLVGDGASMEFTTDDGTGLQATRLLLRGNGVDDIEFYRGTSGFEALTMKIEGSGDSGARFSFYNEVGGESASLDTDFAGSGSSVFDADLIATQGVSADPLFVNVSVADSVGVGTSTPGNVFHVQDSISAAASTANHVAQIENSNQGFSPDVLVLKVGTLVNLGSGSSFITFKRGDDVTLGLIVGDNAGGVSYTSNGADYAEWLQHLDSDTSFEPGDVVGVFAGRISHRTEGADQVMVISTAPIVVGNDPGGDDGPRAGWDKVAFIGQAPVKVRGTVTVGDFLVPSGNGDGYAIAIPAADISPEQLQLVFATAWEHHTSTGEGAINAAIGIDQAAAAGSLIRKLQDELNQQRADLELLQDQFRQLRYLVEASRS